ncbi:MAG: Citrate lyase subunit beta / citryl-CoA lyase [Hydrocarboniphaga sp.]|uniref:HpcH/HpaI aldolase/citrate lyase family protein n=1 Tax=Hydrocarboniphaga sp. TaxID=2033016 RepID=UPI0026163B2B|nr:CoA ester lyase [Hydrocarboniphaga sp.]MDB5971525.1 Citrate lyase subunit beta / citryl-CoA lyase [Hydrocarboniphaga sp.]
MIRSALFVPADSEKKMARAAGAGADALVLDLEDAVLPERKPLARSMMCEYLGGAASRDRLWVRVNDLASGELLRDLAAVVPARPAGILLPKIRGPEDVSVVGHYLDALESEHGLTTGQIRITAIVTETPSSVLRLGELVKLAHPRIQVITWGGEDLSSAMGAGDPRLPAGGWRPTYEYARSQCLLTAHALSVEALDTVYVDFKNTEGLRLACQASRYDGFTGRIAIHPDQVPVINEAFTPTANEKAMAQKIVDAFSSGAGAVSIDGKMYDIPHLKAARRILSA